MNVTEDLNDPEEGELKKTLTDALVARLAAVIGCEIERLGLTPGDALGRLGCSPEEASLMETRGLLDFSAFRLVEMANALQFDVRVFLSPPESLASRFTIMVVARQPSVQGLGGAL